MAEVRADGSSASRRPGGSRPVAAPAPRYLGTAGRPARPAQRAALWWRWRLPQRHARPRLAPRPRSGAPPGLVRPRWGARPPRRGVSGDAVAALGADLGVPARHPGVARGMRGHLGGGEVEDALGASHASGLLAPFAHGCDEALEARQPPPLPATGPAGGSGHPRAHAAARASSSARSRALCVSAAARSNSARASPARPSLARRSPRTLGKRW